MHLSSTYLDGIDINLFAGAGGLAIGLYEAGFSPTHFFEIDKYSCRTLRRNTSVGGTLKGIVHEGGVEGVDWRLFAGRVRLLAGGVPCQPFSLGGKHKAHRDGRNLFPEMMRAVRTVRPKVVLIENVRGLLRHTFQPYFDYIIRQLQIPSLAPTVGEQWSDHDQRIRRHQCNFGYRPEYHVTWCLVDAADYGVPQNRHRVFIVATPTSLPPYSFPEPIHSSKVLKASQKSGEYWLRHGLSKRAPHPIAASAAAGPMVRTLPWRTVRETLSDLPAPAESEFLARFNHWEIPGAKSYAGHSGSAWDLPSKTIKAGVHGVPGGENIVQFSNGKVRYFTLREAARLQTFPDNHLFEGARIHITRQIGNAVPSKLAAAVARPLYELISLVCRPAIANVPERVLELS